MSEAIELLLSLYGENDVAYYDDELDGVCPECGEPLEEDGYCPNGCLDDDDFEDEEEYHDDLEDVEVGYYDDDEEETFAASYYR